MQSESTKRRTASQFINSLANLDLTANLACRSASCMQEVLPSSLGVPPLTNTDFEKRFSKILPYLKSLDLEVKDLCEDREGKKIWMWVEGKVETVLGKFEADYIFMLEFEMKGKKGDGGIVKVRELVDERGAEHMHKVVNFIKSEGVAL